MGESKQNQGFIGVVVLHCVPAHAGVMGNVIADGEATLSLQKLKIKCVCYLT